MKVLLVTDVDKLGWFGDVVEVADGFARNYLLPEKMAVVPTEAKLRSLQQETAKRAEQRLQDVKRLKQAVEAVEGAEAVIASKANEQGHLFGSVAAHEIAANLREQGFSVADEVVQLQENIKDVGTRQVELKFADDLKVTVNVVVVAQQDDASESSDQK